MSLNHLLQRRDIWRGSQRHGAKAPAEPSGNAALDAQLPDGGWPLGAVTELLAERHGGGELRLLLPTLVRLSRGERWQVWVNPPLLPYAPALGAAGLHLERLLLVQPQEPAQQLWALEQAARSSGCAAVLGWPPEPLDERHLRRLQLAAEQSRIPVFLIRPASAARHPSPAALRLQLQHAPRGWQARVLKCRGAHIPSPIPLEPAAVTAMF